MADVYLGMGSNLGDRSQNLRAAVDAVAALPCTLHYDSSAIYETPPMGPQDQGHYLNLAMRITTTSEPYDLLDHLQAIEQQLGRAPREDRAHWGPREIDIDMLLYDDCVIDTPRLKIPHPGIAERWFVLRPLVDLSPELMHPRLNRSVSALLENVTSPTNKETTR